MNTLSKGGPGENESDKEQILPVTMAVAGGEVGGWGQGMGGSRAHIPLLWEVIRPHWDSAQINDHVPQIDNNTSLR